MKATSQQMSAAKPGWRGGLRGPIPLSRRLARRIEIDTATRCWLWKGRLDKDGYGKLSVQVNKRSKGKLAHRLMYEIVFGQIPDGKQIDHKCRTRCCVNPFHLEPVTCFANITRGQTGIHNASVVECPRGHPYDLANTRIVKTYQCYGMFGRQCRACDRERKARLRALRCS